MKAYDVLDTSRTKIHTLHAADDLDAMKLLVEFVAATENIESDNIKLFVLDKYKELISFRLMIKNRSATYYTLCSVE